MIARLVPVAALLLIPMTILIPVASAFASELQLGSQKIILDTTVPQLDDRMFFDVAPAYLPISGEVSGSGIRNVTVTYDDKTQECGAVSGNHVLISCQFLISSDTEPVIFTITDLQGNVVSDTRNMTGIPFPPHPEDNVAVSGFIVDSNGTPVRDARISFDMIAMGKHYSRATISDIHGRYWMLRTIAGPQKITVQKDGFRIKERDIIVRPTPFDQQENFTLSRYGEKEAPLDVPLVIGSIILGITFFVLNRYRH